MKSWKMYAAMLSILPLSLRAQQQNELNEVVVSDNRITLPLSESSRNISIISRQDIESMPVQNLNELIQTVAGIDVRQRGAWGMQGDVSTRGGTFEQTLILVNGIKMNDPQTGHHNLNLGIDIADIERIEILKGPAASRYGLNSFSGVINIVTKPAAKNSAKAGILTMQSASNNVLTNHNSGYGIKSSVNLGTKNWRNTIQINRTQSTGYRANTEFLRQQFFYQTQLENKAGKFGAMASYLDNAFGASGFYAFPIDSSSVESVRTGFGAITHQKIFGKFNWNSKIYWRNNFDEYTLFREKPSYYQNRHTTNTGGGESHLTYSYKYGKVGAGIELREEQIRSTNLGHHQRSNLGFFAENRTWLLKQKLNIGAGFYLNKSSAFGTQFLPSIDANYQIGTSISAFANYGTSFRVPSFTDLYYVGPTNVGNANLKPEEAANYEFGAKWINDAHRLQASSFLQQSANLIDWVRDSISQPWMPRNYESAATKGIDVNYKWTNFKNRNSRISLKSANVSYTYLNINLNSSGEVISRYALTHLAHQLTSRFVIGFGKNLELNITGRYFDRISYKSYWLVDTRLKYRQESFDVYVDYTNLLNTNYIEAAQAPMPGRWMRVGIDFRLF